MTYAVFLRAVNLGKHNKMPMKELRVWLEELGFSDIQTYLQTGNIWLESKLKDPEKVAEVIERMLEGRDYKKVHAMVRTEEQIRDLLEVNPFAPDAGLSRYVTFLRRPSPLQLPPHPRFEVRSRRVLEVVGLLDRNPVERASFNLNSHVESRLKTPGTSRYWHVVQDFLELI